ncbi:sortase domain-bontaining protein [Streptomyces canus]|uniref:sortase domain-containing protein n=1 Tax=Streptomyces canus TaxID=58343 RepID=UPI00371F2B57
MQVPVVARGLTVRGALDPPPFDQPGVVGWDSAGAKPGAAGTALMVGHVDTAARPAVCYKVSALRPGETVGVFHDDGRIAEFTVDDVQVLTRDRFRRLPGPTGSARPLPRRTAPDHLRRRLGPAEPRLLRERRRLGVSDGRPVELGGNPSWPSDV